MRMLKNQKGNILINILIALLVSVMLGGAVTTLYIYGLDSFKIDTNYTAQQHKVVRSIQLLRKDIAEAQKIVVSHDGGILSPTIKSIKVIFPSGPAEKLWKFEDGSLKVNGSVAVDGLETTSRFGFSTNRLILCIQPVATNTGKYQWKNIKNPIVTEYSVKYKVIEHN